MILAQISDLHLRPRGVACYRVSETATFADRAVDALLALRPQPDAVLITGDLVDFGEDAEYELALEILDGISLPIYAIPGNHDAREPMRHAFRDREWMPDTGPIQFDVDIAGLRLIALDSLVEGKPYGIISEESLIWLDETLSRHAEQPTIVAVHHPPITCDMRHMDAINLRNADALADVVTGHGQIERIICGHHHRAIVKRFAGTIVQVAPSVAHQVALMLGKSDRALFNFEPAAFYLHCWREGDGVASHLAYVERYPGPYSFWAHPDHPFP